MSEQQELAPKGLHVFHVDEANEYWIGLDAADVAAQRLEMFGGEYSTDFEEDYIGQLDDDYVMKIQHDEDDPSSTESHTCAEWCAKNGRGLLVACEP